MAPSEELRLQVYLARSGLGSRRSCEDLIRGGRVRVNGNPVELGAKVDPDRDEVTVDGKPVNVRRQDYILLHKPRGYVTTRDDPQERKTVYDLLPRDLHHLFHVGRLDRDSSGALLLTNDGDTANRLLHPRYGTVKTYRVDVVEEPTAQQLSRLTQGVRLEDGLAKAVGVELVGESKPGIYRVILQLREGKNREVRRMFDAIGHPVHRLLRTDFGPIRLGSLGPGRWRRLRPNEIRALRD